MLDKLVHGVATGHPADEARVVGQRQDRVPLDAKVKPRRLALAGQESVDQTEELHDALVLPQVLAALEEEEVGDSVACRYDRGGVCVLMFHVLAVRSLTTHPRGRTIVPWVKEKRAAARCVVD